MEKIYDTFQLIQALDGNAFRREQPLDFQHHVQNFPLTSPEIIATERILLALGVKYIDLSEADFEDALLQQENHRVDTRQGVAVEYLPEKPKPEHRPAEAIA